MLLGLAVAVVILGIKGFPGATLQEVAIVGACTIGAGALSSLPPLWSAWRRAPAILEAELVYARRERDAEIQGNNHIFYAGRLREWTDNLVAHMMDELSAAHALSAEDFERLRLDGADLSGKVTVREQLERKYRAPGTGASD